MFVRAKEMVILGTQYAGEMKKGIFTVMHYLMPKRGILSLHSGCNVGMNDDVTLFFGLSGIVSSCQSSCLVAHGHVFGDKPMPGACNARASCGHVSVDRPIPGACTARVFMMPCPHAFLLHLHFLRLQAGICPVQKCFHCSSDTAQYLRLGA